MDENVAQAKSAKQNLLAKKTSNIHFHLLENDENLPENAL